MRSVSRNMAAILIFDTKSCSLTEYIFDIWTSMLWSVICQTDSVSHDQILGNGLELIEVKCFSFKLAAGQVLIFDWIAGLSQIYLL